MVYDYRQKSKASDEEKEKPDDELLLEDDQYMEAISKIQKTNFMMLKSMLEKFGEVL